MKKHLIFLCCLVNSVVITSEKMFPQKNQQTSVPELDSRHQKYLIHIQPPIKKELGLIWIMDKNTTEIKYTAPFCGDIVKMQWDKINTDLLRIKFSNKSSMQLLIK